MLLLLCFARNDAIELQGTLIAYTISPRKFLQPPAVWWWSEPAGAEGLPPK